ncbi:hypothetical protein C9994_06970 [Marivirga lumbricoides]|uniref:Uncharacterized protein n=1 Tax=Marivirga lumbricoides TaxID=1046115 RepID=A0A2T4DRT0_9BACT|nr:hypothetical protein C9994_06970 [Marivirga lumbricoides]
MIIKFFTVSVLNLFLVYNSVSQEMESKDNWLERKGGKLFYGLEGYSFTSFLKITNGVLAYSQEKGKVFYLNNEHVIKKQWDVKTHHKVLENPQFYYYDYNTVVLGSFLDKNALWFDLGKLEMYEKREKKNNKSKFLKIHNYYNIRFGNYQLVLNQNNNHSKILASLYAYKGIRKKKVYILDIPNSGVANTGNIIDFKVYQNHLWLLDVIDKKIIVFNKDLNVILEKDIKDLWSYNYLEGVQKTGLMIKIDCQFYYDNINDSLYLSKQSYSTTNGIDRNTSLYTVSLNDGNMELNKILERDSYLNIKQISAGKMYILEPGQEKALKDRSFSIIDQGKYSYIYEIAL